MCDLGIPIQPISIGGLCFNGTSMNEEGFLLKEITMELLIATLDLAKETRRIDDWKLMNFLSYAKAGGSNPGHRHDRRPCQCSGQGNSRVIFRAAITQP
jgi:hypothetical protein